MIEPRHEFRRQLAAIDVKVGELFGMLAEDLPRATRALLAGDAEVPQMLAEREQMIDSLYPEIERLVNREIVLQAPVASDLRFLLSVLRVAPEIERSHDLVMHIASQSGRVPGCDLTVEARDIVERLGKMVAEMWHQAAGSWRQCDRSAVQTLTACLGEVHELHAGLITELESGRMPLPVAMNMALVARDYDRLGAHAVNITRRAAYLAGLCD